MNNIKCPFCGKELECCGIYIDGTKKLWCDKCKLFGDNRLFEKLIRTRKALDVAVDALKLFCGEDVSYYSQSKIDARNARTALEQITELEQKDVK